MAESQRRIELQSPDDLQYLVSNVRRAANEKIDKDLPPIEGEDKMRERVEELVHSVRLFPWTSYCPTPVYTLKRCADANFIVRQRCFPQSSCKYYDQWPQPLRGIHQQHPREYHIFFTPRDRGTRAFQRETFREGERAHAGRRRANRGDRRVAEESS